MKQSLSLEILPGRYQVSRLTPDADIIVAEFSIVPISSDENNTPTGELNAISAIDIPWNVCAGIS